MSVLIKGMEMPKNCDECFFVGRGFPDWCSLPQIPKDEDEIDDTNNRPDWCPLEEVPPAQPEPCEDAVSRQAVYNVLDKMPVRGFKKDGETIHGLISLSQVNSAIIDLPSVQTEPLDEWCTDCKEYDHKRHCCPRWNRVIRTTLEDIPHWIPCSERLPEEYGEYRITWKTSCASNRRFIGDCEYEETLEWDIEHDRWKGQWLLADYIKEYPDVEVIAWKPLEEPYAERRTDESD